MTTVDTFELEAKVKQMFWEVAEQPHGAFPCELGAKVATRAGEFSSDRARNASAKYGVKSISVLARKLD